MGNNILKNINGFNLSLDILIACFNSSAYLDNLFEKIIQLKKIQNIKINLIILDDGSSDDTWDILTNKCVLFSNLRLYKNEKNMGVFFSRLKLINLATSDFIIFIDADDYISSNAVE